MITKEEIEELILKTEIKQEDLIKSKAKLEEDIKANYNGEKLEKMLYIIDQIEFAKSNLEILYMSTEQYDEEKLEKLKKDTTSKISKTEKKIKAEYKLASIFETSEVEFSEDGRSERRIFEEISQFETELEKLNSNLTIVKQVLRTKRKPKEESLEINILENVVTV